MEIGGTAGVHIFDEHNELGVEDGPDAPSEQNSVLLGVRIGGFFNEILGAEAEVGILPTRARELDYRVTNLTFRAQAVAQLRASHPETIVVPFLLLGAGAFSVVAADNEQFMTPATRIGPDTDFAFHAGAGVKLRLGEQLGLRIDARYVLVPSSDNPRLTPHDRSLTQDFELLGTVYLELGRGRTQRIVDAPRPPEDDLDHDAVRGALDHCPGQPEDRDGFEDHDGCPDDDNDGDGIDDAADLCPMIAEDRDGFEDDDGCPDNDNDGDGLLDGVDRCPLEPEDLDGFDGHDGCPDPDNDGDGVLDADDPCPDDPEPRRGPRTGACPEKPPVTSEPEVDGAVDAP